MQRSHNSRFRRFAIAPLLACLAFWSGAHAAQEFDDAALLAAARAADGEWQRHLTVTARGMASQDPARRIAAMREFSRIEELAAIPLLRQVIERPGAHTAEELQVACAALGHLALSMGGATAAEAAPAVRKLIDDKNADVRLAAMNLLDLFAKANAPEHTPKVKDAEDALRIGAVTALGEMKVADASALLIQALAKDRRQIVRRGCAIALGRLGDRGAAPALREALTDSDPAVRRYAAEAMVLLEDKRGIPNLLMALEANVAGDYLTDALVKLAGQDFGFHTDADMVRRREAIERAFVWYSENAKNF